MNERIYNALQAINIECIDCADWGLTDDVEGLSTSDYFDTVYDLPMIGRYLYCFLDFSRHDYSAILDASPRYCLNIKEQPTWQVLIWEVEVV